MTNQRAVTFTTYALIDLSHDCRTRQSVYQEPTFH